MVRIALALIALFYMQCATALTQVTASVDKNPVMLNESLILTVVANDSIDSSAFDSSSLHKDFIVGRTSTSSHQSWINGDSSQTTTWTTLLMPRQAGKFVIPALTIGKLRTTPINIDVIDKPISDESKSPNLFITSQLSASEVYVQELLTLTVKLHFSIELVRGSLSEPVLPEANIAKIGEDKEATEIIKGVRYHTIERTYSITPQQSGTFTINSPYFEGELAGTAQRRSSFFNFNQNKPIRVKGDSLPITVKPIPAEIQGSWLPSELVTLHQEWQPEPSKFVVGEPITRVLTLTAASLSEAQLPELTMSVPNGLKVYPDQPQLHSRANKNNLVSQKVQNFALVASKPGKYTLPAVKVTWWNTVTNKKQEAIIAEQTITIAENKDWQAPKPLVSNNTVAQDTSSPTPNTVVLQPTTPWLQWLFLGLWLTTCLAWYLSSRKGKIHVIYKEANKDITTKAQQLNHKQLEKVLFSACKKNQGESVLPLIVTWISYTYPQVNTLDDIIHVVDDTELNAALNELQSAYFGKSPQSWNGTKLLNILKKISTCQNKKADSDFTLNP